VAAFSSPASYQIENLGAQLLSRIDGCHFSILGLPLLELLGILREHGLKLVASRQ
jgi:septum formation protein